MGVHLIDVKLRDQEQQSRWEKKRYLFMAQPGIWYGVVWWPQYYAWRFSSLHTIFVFLFCLLFFNKKKHGKKVFFSFRIQYNSYKNCKFCVYVRTNQPMNLISHWYLKQISKNFNILLLPPFFTFFTLFTPFFILPYGNPLTSFCWT